MPFTNLLIAREPNISKVSAHCRLEKFIICLTKAPFQLALNMAECYVGGYHWFLANCQPFLLVKIDFQYDYRLPNSGDRIGGGLLPLTL